MHFALCTIAILLQSFGWQYFGHEAAAAYAAVAIEAEATCTGTRVTVSDPNQAFEPGDSLYFVYANLEWSDDRVDWLEQDVMTVLPYETSGHYSLPAIYLPESHIALWNGDPADSADVGGIHLIAETDVTSKAYTYRLTYTTEVRPMTHVVRQGSEMDVTGENHRPTDPQVITGLSAPFTVLFESHPTPNVISYKWEIYRGKTLLTTRMERNQRYTFEGTENDQNYKVRLEVHGAEDCNNVTPDSVLVSVALSQLRVPNVFTPNGDGSNDEFRVIYQSLKEYHISIFNRWGKEVYSSTNPDAGWNGYIGGRKAAEGAYYYVIRAKGTDGRDYKMGGDINLIRGK